MNQRRAFILTGAAIPLFYGIGGMMRIGFAGLTKPDEISGGLGLLVVIGLCIAAGLWYLTRKGQGWDKPMATTGKVIAWGLLFIISVGGWSMAGGTVEKRLVQAQEENERKSASEEKARKEAARIAAMTPEEIEAEALAKKEAALRSKAEKEAKLLADKEEDIKRKENQARWAESKAEDDRKAQRRTTLAAIFGKKLKEALNDPDSAKDISATFYPSRNAKDPEAVVCVEVRAKNGFGAYVKNFGAMALYPDDSLKMAFGGESDEKTVKMWNQFCANRDDGFDSGAATFSFQRGLGRSGF